MIAILLAAKLAWNGKLYILYIVIQTKHKCIKGFVDGRL